MPGPCSPFCAVVFLCIDLTKCIVLGPSPCCTTIFIRVRRTRGFLSSFSLRYIAILHTLLHIGYDAVFSGK